MYNVSMVLEREEGMSVLGSESVCDRSSMVSTMDRNARLSGRFGKIARFRTLFCIFACFFCDFVYILR